MNKSEQGFTVLELLIVIAVMAILFSVLGVGYERWRINSMVSAAANTFAQQVMEARTTAKRRNVCIEVRANGTTKYELWRYPGRACSGTPVKQSYNLTPGVNLSGTGLPVGFQPPYGTTDGTSRLVTMTWQSSTIKRDVRLAGVFGKVIIK